VTPALWIETFLQIIYKDTRTAPVDCQEESNQGLVRHFLLGNTEPALKGYKNEETRSPLSTSARARIVSEQTIPSKTRILLRFSVGGAAIEVQAVDSL